MSSQRKLIYHIANGGDGLVGEGIDFHWRNDVKNRGGAAIQWKGGGVNHTHQFIAARAILMLENSIGYDAFYKGDCGIVMMQNSDWPDKYENDGGTYAGHFYDPTTARNYTGASEPTARTRFIYWANEAVVNYYRDMKYAMASLGRAIHYLSDLCEPHHSRNFTVMNSDHAEFEKWVDIRRANYIRTYLSKYDNYYLDTWSQRLEKIADLCASSGRIVKWNFLLSASIRDYDAAAKITLDMAQEYAVIFLACFLNEVGQI